MNDMKLKQDDPFKLKRSMEGVLGKDPTCQGIGNKPAAETVIPLNDGHYTPPSGGSAPVEPKMPGRLKK